MKFIELTKDQDGPKEKITVNMALVISIWRPVDADYTFLSHGQNVSIRVKETPREIMALINGEWIKNTGKAPDGDLVIEAKLIGDASTFDFDLDSFLPITEYKILGKA